MSKRTRSDSQKFGNPAPGRRVTFEQLRRSPSTSQLQGLESIPGFEELPATPEPLIGSDPDPPPPQFPDHIEAFEPFDGLRHALNVQRAEEEDRPPLEDLDLTELGEDDLVEELIADEMVAQAAVSFLSRPSTTVRSKSQSVSTSVSNPSVGKRNTQQTSNSILNTSAHRVVHESEAPAANTPVPIHSKCTTTWVEADGLEENTQRRISETPAPSPGPDPSEPPPARSPIPPDDSGDSSDDSFDYINPRGHASMRDIAVAAYYDIQVGEDLKRDTDRKIRRFLNALTERWCLLVQKARTKLENRGIEAPAEFWHMENTLRLKTMEIRTSRKVITRLTGIKVRKMHRCPGNCMAFNHYWESECGICGSPRYKVCHSRLY